MLLDANYLHLRAGGLVIDRAVIQQIQNYSNFDGSFKLAEL